MLLKEPDLRALSLTISTATEDRKSGSAGMPRPISYAVFCLKKNKTCHAAVEATTWCANDARRNVASTPEAPRVGVRCVAQAVTSEMLRPLFALIFFFF